MVLPRRGAHKCFMFLAQGGFVALWTPRAVRDPLDIVLLLVQYGTRWMQDSQTLCCCSCFRYLAIVKGRLEGSGRSDVPLQGKAATTDYRAEAHTDSCGGGSQEGGGGGGGGSGWGCCLTTVSLWPRTGRTHQLRKHMAYLGHPILGDPRYRWVRYCTAVLVPGHQYCRCW